MVGCHGGVVSVWNSSFRALGRALLNMGWSECLSFMVWSLVYFQVCFCRSFLETLAWPEAGRISGSSLDPAEKDQEKLPQKDQSLRWPHGPQCHGLFCLNPCGTDLRNPQCPLLQCPGRIN